MAVLAGALIVVAGGAAGQVGGEDGATASAPAQAKAAESTPGTEAAHAAKVAGTGGEASPAPAQGGSAATRTVAELVGPGGARACGVRDDLECRAWVRLGCVMAGVLAYFLLLLVARGHKVALPTRRVLLAEIAAVEARVEQYESGAGAAGVDRVRTLLQKSRAALRDSGMTCFLDSIFWSRGSEIASWSLLHEAELHLVSYMAPEELRAGLERASSQLRVIPGPVAPALAERIEVELAHTVLAVDDPVTALLREALSMLQAPDRDLRAAVAGAIAQPVAPDAQPPALVAARLAAVLEAVPVPCAGGLTGLLPPGTATPMEFRLLLAHADMLLAASAHAAARLRAALAPGAATGAERDALVLAGETVLAPAEQLAVRMQAALNAAPTWPIGRWRVLLHDALAVSYGRCDTDYATLASWQNKVVWMIKCSLLLIVALGMALGHEALFLVGAAGGLMSRLSRSLDRADVVTDYGASWSRLFLSPVIGALAGWAALLLAALMLKLGVLGTLFETLDWDQPVVPLSLGIAFLFGFSERAFDSVISALDSKIMSRSASATPQSAGGASLAVTTTTLMGARVGQPYFDALAAGGGTGPYEWSVAAGVLPDGLKLAGATISGTVASGAKSSTFTARVRDKDGKTAVREFTIKVA